MATGEFSDVAFGILAPASSVARADGNSARREGTDLRRRRRKTGEAEDPDLTDDSVSPANQSVHELDHMA